MMVRVWCYRAAVCGTCVSDVEYLGKVGSRGPEFLHGGGRNQE